MTKVGDFESVAIMEIYDKFEFENKYLKQGYKYIAGIDEVGRGPLAGPVVCAAVIMPLGGDIIEGVDDSKLLSAKKREQLALLIAEKAVALKICEVSSDEIDQINILCALKKCMKMCIEGLQIQPDVVLTDAVKLDIAVKQESIVKGDLKSYSIGAASIVAKVYRDRLMEDYAGVYPDYGFNEHKGYGTKKHIERIKEIGPCAIHRKTFIKNFWAEEEKTAR